MKCTSEKGVAPPNRPRACQLPARRSDITAVVGNDASQVLKELYLGQRLLLRREALPRMLLANV